MKPFAFLVIFATLAFTCQASRLVRELVDTYSKILQEGFNKNHVDVEGIVELMHLHDGNPKYNKAALEYIAQKLGGTEPVPFERLYDIVDQIYGDQISDDPFQPQEIHLAITNKPSAMKVMWVTMQALDKPQVQFVPAFVKKQSDTINWKLAQTTTAINYTYRVEQKWWPIFTGIIYEVDMTGLNPNEEYIYRVGGYDSVNGTMRYSEEYTFRAQPESNNPSRKTKIVTLADHGTFMLFGFETVNRIVKMMDEMKPDMVFVAGDLSYAGLSSAMPRLNISKEDEFEHIWDLLAIQNQPVATRIPWMVGNGNHERFYDWAAYMNRYKMPNNAPALASNGNFWYTFSYGNIQWIQISSEHPLDTSSAQYAFLQAALAQANANREVVPWIVLTIHKPLYCTVEGSPHFADVLESILLQYDVDITITGHMHAYERIHPVKAGVVTAYPKRRGVDKKFIDIYEDATGAGPVHIMQGHAGGMQAERFVQPKPDYSAFRMANGIIPPDRSRSSAQDWAQEHHMSLDLSDTTTMDYHVIEELPLISAEDRSLSVEYNYSHTYGFGVITAYNATHLHYEAVPDMDGEFNHDQFWLIKKHGVLMV